MGIDPLAQGIALLGALLLGALLGCVYDALRLLRWRCKALVAGGLDLLFWVLCLLFFVVYCLRFAGGELRWDLFCGAIAGISLYFFSLSPFILWSYRIFARIFMQIFRICLLPFYLARAILKKIQENAKKYFISRRKWYKMCSGILEMDAHHRKRFHDSEEERGSQVEAQAGLNDHKNRRTSGILLSDHHDAQSAKRHRRISRHAQRPAASGEHSRGEQQGIAP